MCIYIQRCKNFKTDRFLPFLVIEEYVSLDMLYRRIHAYSSSVLLSSEPSNCPLEGYLLPSSEIRVKFRAIPMHNFLLRYFPAYRARMFPPVALLVICAHVLASACLYIRASVSGRNRASGNAEE